jgi:hypothetical protein
MPDDETYDLEDGAAPAEEAAVHVQDDAGG